ncbi:MAG TPA: TIGR02611 family protein [Micromonosporaceae bacterium]
MPGSPAAEDSANELLRANWRTRLARWLARVRAKPGGRLAVRIVVALLGLIVLLLGIILLPLPGPGWLIIFAGIAIWAIEFRWARRLLGFARHNVRRWNLWYLERPLSLRVVVGALLVLLVLAIIWASLAVSFGVDFWQALATG